MMTVRADHSTTSGNNTQTTSGNNSQTTSGNNTQTSQIHLRGGIDDGGDYVAIDLDEMEQVIESDDDLMELYLELGYVILWFKNDELIHTEHDDETKIYLTEDMTGMDIYAKILIGKSTLSTLSVWAYPTPSWIINFDLKGHGGDVAPVRVYNGRTPVMPVNPEDDDWIFKGWFLDPDCTYEFDATDFVYDNVTLYAKWVRKAKNLELTFLEPFPGLDVQQISVYSDDAGVSIRNRTEWEPVGTPTDETVFEEGMAYTASFRIVLTDDREFPELLDDAYKSELVGVKGDMSLMVARYPLDGEFVGNAWLDIEPVDAMANRVKVTITYIPRYDASDLRISGRSLTLYDTIAIAFKIDKSSLEGKYHDPYLVVTQAGHDTKLTKYEDNGTQYVFSYRVSPHMMAEKVIVKPHALSASNLDVIGESMEYSVETYCRNMLNNQKYQGEEYATFRRLCVDILRYGDAAQIYANYKTDQLATAGLTAEQLAMGTDVSVPMSYVTVKDKWYETVSEEDARAAIDAAALYLEGAVNIQFKFTTPDLTGLWVVVTDGLNVMENCIPDPAKTDDKGRYYVNFANLNAGQMRKTVYATVVDRDKRISNTFRYSIESYVYGMKGKGVPHLDNLLDAMMRYGDSAANYVAEKNG